MRRIPYSVVATAALLALLLPSTGRADETIYLLDNTRIVGKLLHYYDGVLTVKLPNGARAQLPAHKVKRVQFKLPKPRPALSTPHKTFTRMRTAALKGDLQTYVDSYSAYYQMFLNQQIAAVKQGKFIKQLKQQYGSGQMKVLKTKTKGNTAVMKVRFTQGDKSREGEIRFVKENKEWKMILPL